MNQPSSRFKAAAACPLFLFFDCTSARLPYNSGKEDTPVEMKAIDLFKAYSDGQLPQEGGYIVTSFFQQNSAYAKYEIVAYNGVKSLYLSEDGLTFQTDGNKLFVLSEPVNYDRKYMEPFTRDGQHQVPHRFSEVDQITAKNMTRIMISKQPVIAYSSFTICRPTTLNFSLLFYNLPDVFASIASYFEKTLYAEANVPKEDAVEAGRRIIAGLKRFTIWQELAEKAAAVAAKPAAKPKPKPKAKKVAAKKPAAGKKAPAKKAAAKKAPAKKPAAKKAAAKKPAAKKPAAKKRR